MTDLTNKLLMVKQPENNFWKIQLEDSFMKDLKKLGKSNAKAILLKLEKLSEKINSENLHPSDLLDPLRENLSGLWKYRIADYRVIFQIENDELIVLALAVGHRSKVYKGK